MTNIQAAAYNGARRVFKGLDSFQLQMPTAFINVLCEKGKNKKRKGILYLLQCQPPIWPTFQNAYNQVYATLTQVIWHFEVTIENGIFQLGHSGAFERHTSGNHKI